MAYIDSVHDQYQTGHGVPALPLAWQNPFALLTTPAYQQIDYLTTRPRATIRQLTEVQYRYPSCRRDHVGSFYSTTVDDTPGESQQKTVEHIHSVDGLKYVGRLAHMRHRSRGNLQTIRQFRYPSPANNQLQLRQPQPNLPNGGNITFK